jgi:hypothetical protein
MLKATPLEEQILQDIREKTGLVYRRVGGIRTDDPGTFAAVAPILADWADRITDANHRHAIYDRFNTPLAHPYLDKLISWWREESHPLASGCLTQVLTTVSTCQDAERLWKLQHEFTPRPFYYLLASKLANCASVAKEARDELVAALESNTLLPGDVAFIAQVKDEPRIQNWLKQQLNSAEPALRLLAKRAARRGQSMPTGVVYAPIPPDRTPGREVFSTECDLRDLKGVLREITNKFRLTLSPAIGKGSFLLVADLSRWLVSDVLMNQEEPAALWFRLEDIDTVELVLLTQRSSSAQHAR